LLGMRRRLDERMLLLLLEDEKEAQEGGVIPVVAEGLIAATRIIGGSSLFDRVVVAVLRLVSLQ